MRCVYSSRVRIIEYECIRSRFSAQERYYLKHQRTSPFSKHRAPRLVTQHVYGFTSSHLFTRQSRVAARPALNEDQKYIEKTNRQSLGVDEKRKSLINTWEVVQKRCREADESAVSEAVGCFIQHLQVGSPRDYRFGCQQGKMEAEHMESGRVQVYKVSSFVRRFFPMFLFPHPAKDEEGVKTLVELQDLSRQTGLGPKSVPEGVFTLAAHHFSQVVDVDDIFTVRILKGREIEQVYSDMAIFNCMTGALGVDLYVQNPKTVRLVAFYREDKLAGRALLWKTEQGEKMLDRVHPDDQGQHVRFAKSLAQKECWVTRPDVEESHDVCMSLQGNTFLYNLCCALVGQKSDAKSQSMDTDSETDVDELIPKDFSVKLRVAGHYPILDTFRFATRPTIENPTFRLSTQKESGMVLPDEIWAANAKSVYRHWKEELGFVKIIGNDKN